MCLIFVDYKNNDRYKLIVAANRDEFHGRVAGPAHFWHNEPLILAGLDKKAGGTWLGITRDGYLAMLTNYRSLDNFKPSVNSRGKLVLDYLTKKPNPETFANALEKSAADYNDYNIIFGPIDDLYCFSTRNKQTTHLEPGLYGLSNELLNTPWPKVTIGKDMINEITNTNGKVDNMQNHALVEGLFSIMKNKKRAPLKDLPDTGIPRRLEKYLSPLFISGFRYGTRNTTIVTIDQDNQVNFSERTYSRWGLFSNTTRFTFTLQSSGNLMKTGTGS